MVNLALVCRLADLRLLLERVTFPWLLGQEKRPFFALTRHINTFKRPQAHVVFPWIIPLIPFSSFQAPSGALPALQQPRVQHLSHIFGSQHVVEQIHIVRVVGTKLTINWDSIC